MNCKQAETLVAAHTDGEVDALQKPLDQETSARLRQLRGQAPEHA